MPGCLMNTPTGEGSSYLNSGVALWGDPTVVASPPYEHVCCRLSRRALAARFTASQRAAVVALAVSAMVLLAACEEMALPDRQPPVIEAQPDDPGSPPESKPEPEPVDPDLLNTSNGQRSYTERDPKADPC